MPRSRTNIEIDDDYVHAVMQRYGVRTKTEAVDLALRHLAGQPLSRSEALAMRGARAIATVPIDRGPDDDARDDDARDDDARTDAVEPA